MPEIVRSTPEEQLKVSHLDELAHNHKLYHAPGSTTKRDL